MSALRRDRERLQEILIIRNTMWILPYNQVIQNIPMARADHGRPPIVRLHLDFGAAANFF